MECFLKSIMRYLNRSFFLAGCGWMLLGCATELPRWGNLSERGLVEVVQIADYPQNTTPATPSMMADFELIDEKTPPQMGFFWDKTETPTPLSIVGVKTITTPTLQAMLGQHYGGKDQYPLLIDVRSHNQSLVTLRGAVWLNGVGYAYQNSAWDETIQSRLKESLALLTANNTARSLVFFCAHPRCALSFNAALRAVRLGYSNVYWYRGGVEAWFMAGLPLVVLSWQR